MPSKQSRMLARILSNAITSVRLHGDVLAEHRRQICFGTDGIHERCSEVLIENGRFRCRICKCEDPTRNRPRCPVFKW